MLRPIRLAAGWAVALLAAFMLNLALPRPTTAPDVAAVTPTRTPLAAPVAPTPSATAGELPPI
ncbi:MAG TPA: hypothetical protein VFJ03_06430, partial [Candidatus Limnocylindria bacterium]|nr:hypothetical protein [Candidatus Limnocylindria bacterium]